MAQAIGIDIGSHAVKVAVLQRKGGVTKAEVSINDRKVNIEYDSSVVDLADIVTAIDDQGYEVAGQ